MASKEQPIRQPQAKEPAPRVEAPPAAAPPPRPTLSYALPLQLATLAVCVVTLVIALWSRPSAPVGQTERADERIALAGAMLNDGLPAEAIAEYNAALGLVGDDPVRKGNLCYLIGKTYFESLKDYEKALAYFSRAMHYNPAHSERSRMEQWTVACLEKLGRPLDARNKIAQATALRPNQTPTSGVIVAKIGDEPITMFQLDEAIGRLPEPAQRRFAELKEKRSFLDEYVMRRLFVNAAVRAGLNRNPKVQAEIDDNRNDVLAGAYMQLEVIDKLTVTPEEARAWYDANRDRIPQARRYEISHITAPSEATATSVVTEAARGANFADLARKYSTDATTRDKGGRLATWAERTPLTGPLAGSQEMYAALSMMTKGQTSPPVKMPSGTFEIAHVDDITSPTIPPFEEVRDLAVNRTKRDKVLKAQQEKLEEFKKAEKVVIYPEAFEEKAPTK